MDSMEFNKIAGATIGALLLFLLLNFFSGMIYGTREAEATAEGEEHGPALAYAVAIEGGEAEGGEAEPQVDLLALFQHPDVAAGEKTFRACGACHAVEAGVNKVGPSLYDVVGAGIAAADGFAYSDAMAALEGDWTPEHLFAFLEDPKGVVPGTKMSFAGLDDPQDRANVIAYLNQTGDTPVDLTEGIEPLAPVAAEGQAAEEDGAGAQAPAGEPGAAGILDPEIEGTEAIGEQAVEGGAAVVEQVQSDAAAAEAESGAEVTGVTVVDTSEEDVEVESVVPLEIEEKDPPAADGALTETPAEERVTQEGASDAPALPADEAATIEPGAVAPVSGEGGETVVAAAAPAGDAAAGEKLFRRCMACHKLEPGKNTIGPTLHGVVGREVASVEGFSYSDALQAHGGVWSPDRLAEFLADPKGVVPGTKMAFSGLKDEQDQIDVITYLQQAAQ